MATLTVKTTALHNLLKTAAVFAANDSTMPMISAVQLSRVGDELVAVSTDRFRLGVVRIPLEDHDSDGEDFTALIPRAAVMTWVPMVKVSAVEGRTSTTTLSVIDKAIHWKRDGAAGEVPDVSSEYNFPKWWGLIPDDPGYLDYDQGVTTARDSDAARFGVTPKYLADFAKAAWHAGDNMIVESTHPSRPIAIRVGAHFLGIIMPVRVATDEANSTETRNHWTTLRTEARQDSEARHAA